MNQPDIVFQRFASRRSQVYGTKGVVAASQPLAVEAGLEILRKGGNAGESWRLLLAWSPCADRLVRAAHPALDTDQLMRPSLCPPRSTSPSPAAAASAGASHIISSCRTMVLNILEQRCVLPLLRCAEEDSPSYERLGTRSCEAVDRLYAAAGRHWAIHPSHRPQQCNCTR